MRRVVWLFIVLGLAGCTTLSPEDSGPNVPVTVNEIQHAISCEFFYAFENTGGSASPFRRWGAIVGLTLSATDTLDVIPGLGSFTAKAGDATLTAQSSSFTVHNEVGDADTISYATNLANSANMTDCPPQHSKLAATGLGLSDFLVGTARILESGGEIFSTVALTDPEKAIFGNLQVSAAAQLQLALTPEDIRTITYTRTFAITRKVGGGLTFKINDISLSLNGSGNGRTRTGNVITVKMGGPKPAPPPVARGNFALAPMGAAAPGGAADALQNSVLAQRKKQLDILKALPQNNVVVVNPPPGP